MGEKYESGWIRPGTFPERFLHFNSLLPGQKDYRYVEAVDPESDYWYRLKSYNGAGPSNYTQAMLGHTFGVGIGGVSPAGPLRVYPNPADDVLHIRMDVPGMEVTGAIIFDMTGRKVAAVEGEIQTLVVDGIPAGVYHLRVGYCNGFVDTRFVKR
jgi:hypothetical protein